MFELLTRVLCEIEAPGSIQSAYLFAQTADNQQSVFEAGLGLLNRQKVSALLIADSGPISGYPGFAAWRKKLLADGVGGDRLAAIPTSPYDTLHTLIEATTLVRYARDNGLDRLVIVAAPFQQLRAFMTTVTVLLREFPELRVYNQVGLSLPWEETVVHSQGTLRCKRAELIRSELERIERYQQKGDVAPESDILNYLKWRDS